MISVAVCIPTYRRPEFLADLLQSVAGLDVGGLDVRVVVVDNDAAGSAEPIVRRFAPLLPAVTYVVEPSRGLAAVRNRLVAIAARLGVDYLAFVDDDELVEPDWLRRLVRTARERNADAVSGVVLPRYDDGVPPWITAGNFFHWPRHPTGEAAPIDNTGNLLLSLACLDGLDGPFDRRFDLTGSEDRHLLERLARGGARMVWCDEAIVHERIPLSRANARWLLRRAYRGGTTFSAIAAEFEPGPLRRLERVGRALARAGYGLATLPPALPRGRAASVRALCHVASGLGGVLGVAGVAYREYEQVHGR